MLDWIDPLLEAAATRGWTVYLLGSAPRVIDRGAEVLAARHPGATFRSHHGYFKPARRG